MQEPMILGKNRASNISGKVCNSVALHVLRQKQAFQLEIWNPYYSLASISAMDVEDNRAATSNAIQGDKAGLQDYLKFGVSEDISRHVFNVVANAELFGNSNDSVKPGCWYEVTGIFKIRPE